MARRILLIPQEKEQETAAHCQAQKTKAPAAPAGQDDRRRAFANEDETPDRSQQ